MASKIQALNAYRPKLEREGTVQEDELVRFIAARSGLNQGTIDYVLCEVRDAVAHFGRAGRGVKIPGLGTYLPNVRLDGTFDFEHRQSPELVRALNEPPFYARERIRNRRNIGKTPEQLIALWNAEHPDDPVD